MKKNYKRLYGYGIIMVVCVLIIVLMAAVSEERIDDIGEQYEETLDTGQKQIRKLEDEIKKLTEENEQLKKQLNGTESLGADLVTTQQAMSDLKDIYQMYKSGNADKAKAQLDKIEPIGFDDATLNYYEVLRDLIK